MLRLSCVRRPKRLPISVPGQLHCLDIVRQMTENTLFSHLVEQIPDAQVPEAIGGWGTEFAGFPPSPTMARASPTLSMRHPKLLDAASRTPFSRAQDTDILSPLLILASIATSLKSSGRVTKNFACASRGYVKLNVYPVASID